MRRAGRGAVDRRAGAPLDAAMNKTGAIWVLVDGRAGNRAQALGVAEALGRPFTPIEIGYSWAAKLPNRLLGAGLSGLDTASRARLTAPAQPDMTPDLVISAGRRTAPAARWIKRRSGGRVKLCHIMDPGAGYADFDLLVIPAHDNFTPPPKAPGAGKIIRVTGAPNRVTPETLRAAAAEWRGRLSAVPAPRIAVITGGSTRRRRFTAAMAHELGQGVSDWARARGGGLFITTSRRTGAEQAAALLAACEGAPAHVHLWGDEGPNPYMGFLGLADAVVVTGESVSMCSEAASAGKAVSIFAPPGLIAPKHARLGRMLLEGGHARPFEAGFPEKPCIPLNTAGKIVRYLQENLVK